ncbi:diguanylate cyclase [Solibacillus merdavium]|uniref:Diguanylate cyclase n=1 Tax=Solibacillus merdavium TaxID=2762218 RepID=A0ABR8XL22_9BACL|nr:diguanylate cyclase [Solibacillus merdavium]MBD8032643.1 diguanylate cyclase [Solibacillus merdavium]
MFIEILSYFCILFTFTLLIYWPFINYFKITPFIDRSIPYVTGIKFGVTGLILTYSAINLVDGVLVNSQFVSVLFSGLLGGPFAILVSGLIIGIGRFFFSEVTMISTIFNYNFILLVLFLFLITRKYEMTSKTVFTYFWLCLVESILISFIGLCFSSQGYGFLLLYGLFTVFAFYFIYIVIHQVKRTNDTVQETNYLRKIDYLTQLPNTTEFEKCIQQLMKKNEILSLLLVDIRDLKMINSKYGYPTGDLIIKQLALHLKEYADKNDAFVGRLSGEEFAIILKDTPPALAIFEADNLIHTIAQQPFNVIDKEVIYISVTIGLSSFPDNGVTSRSLTENLIRASQLAKSNKTSGYFHANNLK